MNEAFEFGVGASATDAAMQIAQWVTAFRNGGPNRRAESLELARKWSLDLDKITERWDEVEAEVSAKEEASKEGASFSLSGMQPMREIARVARPEGEASTRVENKPLEPLSPSAAPVPWAVAERRAREAAWAAKAGKSLVPVAPKALAIVKPSAEVVRLIARAQPEPEPEEEAEPAPVPVPVLFGSAADRSGDAEAVMVSASAPFDNAREWARRRGFRDGQLATFWNAGEFWQWNGYCYEVMSDNKVRTSVYDFLSGGMTQKVDGGEVRLERFKPKPEHVNHLIDGLKSGLGLDLAPGRWLDTQEAAGDVIVFRNGFVNVRTGELRRSTPRLWVKGELEFDYAPDARCPRWEQFLEEVFPGDEEAQDCLEEQMGYPMTDDTKFEKAALWIGLPRSGKSTAAHIQKKLVGSAGWATLSFNSWMRGENSRENMIGKRLLIFADVRLKPGKMWKEWDPGGLDYPSAELLLNIIGRDPVSIGQKFVKAWQGYTALKVLITSNDPPDLQDTGGNLPGKFIKLWFGQSFWDREDPGLRGKLEAELPGIANRCLAAYCRLVTRGRFVQPRSGLKVKRQIDAKNNPMAAFAQARLVIAPEGSCAIWVLDCEFEEWCRGAGRMDFYKSVPRNHLKKHLSQVEGFEFLKHVPALHPHGKPRIYNGFRIRKETDPEVE